MEHGIIFNPVLDWTVFDETVSYAAGDCVLYYADYRKLEEADEPEALRMYEDGDTIRFDGKIYQLILAGTGTDGWAFDGPFSENLLHPYWHVYQIKWALYVFTQAHAAGAWTGTDAERDTRQKDTREDWGLILTSQPIFNPPAQKTKILDPPGGDGVIDLSQAVRGYPLYKNRTGSFTFALAERFEKAEVIRSEIMEFLHGQRMRAILTDDPGYYYEGRFSMNAVKSRPEYGTFVLDYDVGPYKWATTLSTDEDWLWDPFSFEDGVLFSELYTGIALTGTERHLSFTAAATAGAPITPVFTATARAGITARETATNTPHALPLYANTSAEMPGLVLYRGQWLYAGKPVTVTATAETTAVLDVAFRPGRL